MQILLSTTCTFRCRARCSRHGSALVAHQRNSQNRFDRFESTGFFQLTIGTILLVSVTGQSCNTVCGEEDFFGMDRYEVCHLDSQMELCLPMPFLFQLFLGFGCGKCTGAPPDDGDDKDSGGGGGSTGSSGYGSFQITMQFEGVSDTDSSLFKTAASKWASVISGDVADSEIVNSLRDATDCKRNLPVSVDDLHICSMFDDIDGVSGVLGYAGPRVIDTIDGSVRAITGDMVFDSSDITKLKNEGRLRNVIVHEMGHVVSRPFMFPRPRIHTNLTTDAPTPIQMGVGTLWTDNGLQRNSCSYSTKSAVAREWKKIFWV